MRTLEQSYGIMHEIKLIRRIIDLGYDRALEYADLGDEELFTKNRKNSSKDDLLKEISELKDFLHSCR